MKWEGKVGGVATHGEGSGYFPHPVYFSSLIKISYCSNLPFISCASQKVMKCLTAFALGIP